MYFYNQLYEQWEFYINWTLNDEIIDKINIFIDSNDIIYDDQDLHLFLKLFDWWTRLNDYHNIFDNNIYLNNIYKYVSNYWQNIVSTNLYKSIRFLYRFCHPCNYCKYDINSWETRYWFCDHKKNTSIL